MKRRQFLAAAGGLPLLIAGAGRAAPAKPVRPGYVRSPSEFFTPHILDYGELPKFPVEGTGAFVNHATNHGYCTTHLWAGRKLVVPTWDLEHEAPTRDEAFAKSEARLEAIMGDFLKNACQARHGVSILPSTRGIAEERIRFRMAGLMSSFTRRKPRVFFCEVGDRLIGVDYSVSNVCVHVKRGYHCIDFGAWFSDERFAVLGEHGLAVLDTRLIMSERFILGT